MKVITVSVADFCRMVGIGRSKAFELIREHQVVPVRIGRKTLVTVASIEHLIERHSQNPS
jgi:phage antirepressor YoqD-like protein